MICCRSIGHVDPPSFDLNPLNLKVRLIHIITCSVDLRVSMYVPSSQGGGGVTAWDGVHIVPGKLCISNDVAHVVGTILSIHSIQVVYSGTCGGTGT
jgi:hypothetical protein